MRKRWIKVLLVISVIFCMAGCNHVGTTGSSVSGGAVSGEKTAAEQHKYTNGKYSNSTNFYGVFNMGSERRENMKSKAEGIFQYSLDGERLKEIEIPDMRELFYVDDQWIYYDITSEDDHSLYRAPIKKVNGSDEIHLDQQECLVKGAFWVDLMYVGETYLVYYDMESCYRYDFSTKKSSKAAGAQLLEKAAEKWEDFDAFFSEDGGALEGSKNYFYYDIKKEELVSLRSEIGKGFYVLENSGDFILYQLAAEEFKKLHRYNKLTGERDMILEDKQVKDMILPKKKMQYSIGNAHISHNRIYVIVSEREKKTSETGQKLIWCPIGDTKEWHYEEKLYQYMKEIYTQDKEEYGDKMITGDLGAIKYPYVYIENEVHNTHWAMNPFVLYNLETGEGNEYTGNDPEYDYF